MPNVKKGFHSLLLILRIWICCFINTEGCSLRSFLCTILQVEISYFCSVTQFFSFSERKDQIHSTAFPKTLMSCLLYFPSYWTISSPSSSPWKGKNIWISKSLLNTVMHFEPNAIIKDVYCFGCVLFIFSLGQSETLRQRETIFLSLARSLSRQP